MTNSIILIVLVSVLVPIVAIVVVRKSLFGQSKAKQEQAAQLMATGAKARAMITGVEPTGMVVNHIYLQSVVTPNFGLAKFSSFFRKSRINWVVFTNSSWLSACTIGSGFLGFLFFFTS